MVMQKKDIYKERRKKTRTVQGVRKECAFFIAIFYFYAMAVAVSGMGNLENVQNFRRAIVDHLKGFNKPSYSQLPTKPHKKGTFV